MYYTNMADKKIQLDNERRELEQQYPIGTVIYYKNYLGCSRKGVVTGYFYAYGKIQLRVITEMHDYKTIHPHWVIRKA